MADSAAAGPQDIGDVIVTDDATMRRAVAAAAVGNVTEWYDFGVYSYLAAAAIDKVFFGNLPADQASVFTLGTFAVAFLVRPIGGFFFGPLGDKIGRTKVLSITVVMMAAATFLLGLIPSYETIGLAAPVLLLVIRLLQGFSTGGEYGGAMTFIAEYAADRKRGFFGSWLEFGTLTGYAMGATFSTILIATMSTDTLVSWGWRIPFMLALPLGVVGLYLRVKLEETPAFKQLLDESEAKEQGTPAMESLRLIFTKHWRSMLVAGGLIIAWNVTNYVLTNYVPTYTTETLAGAGLETVSSTTSNILQIIVLLVLMAVITFLGRLSDRVGRKPILIAGSVALVVLGLPSVLLLQNGLFGQFGGLMIMGLTLVCFSSICPSTLPALFPTEIRYGGLSITFNLFVSAFAGTAATVIGALILVTGDLNWPGYYLIGAGVVGLISCYFLVESAGRPLEGSKPAVATEQEARELIDAGKT